MTELAKLAVDFLVFAICYVAPAIVVGCAIMYAVGETIEHFTP